MEGRGGAWKGGEEESDNEGEHAQDPGDRHLSGVSLEGSVGRFSSVTFFGAMRTARLTLSILWVAGFGRAEEGLERDEGRLECEDLMSDTVRVASEDGDALETTCPSVCRGRSRPAVSWRNFVSSSHLQTTRWGLRTSQLHSLAITSFVPSSLALTVHLGDELHLDRLKRVRVGDDNVDLVVPSLVRCVSQPVSSCGGG